MPSRQNDKLKKLLGMKEKRVPDMVRHREMNDVRNYNRNQQAKVFENEKRQVARYADTNAPESAKDIGSAFKLQVYTLKLNGLLQAKQDAVQQVELVIGTANAGNQITLGASQLRDARLAPYLNTVFGKAEVVSTFNEMMAFIKTYMQDIFSNDRIRDNAYTSYLTPLSQNLVATANQYPDFYSSLGERGGQQGVNDRRAKAIFRQQAIQLFSLLMAMAENINIQALRPITASDADSYATKNDVDQIITTRGRAVVPGPAPLPAGQPILPLDAPEPPPPAPPAIPPGQQQPNVPAPQPAPQPQQGQPIPRADMASTIRLLQAFEQANPENVGDPLRPGQYRDGQRGFRRAVKDYNEAGGGFLEPPPPARMLDQARAYLIAQRGQPQQQQPAPQPTPLPAGPPQGGPAQDPRLDAQMAQFDTTDLVPTRLGYQRGSPQFGVAETITNLARAVENQNGRVVNAKNDADVQEVYDFLDQRNRPEYEALYQTEAERKAEIRKVIRAMRDARIGFVQAQNLPQTSERALYGMGKQNAREYLSGCGVPSHILNKAMSMHGLGDDATIDELEGSGIFDTLKDFAGNVADSASGWFNTIKANMPTMSDVRRAVGKIVPDQYQDYVPSGLKRTFGDKAKDFFGFGMSGGEFKDDMYRPQQARHREPFDNYFDDRGFRQGAVQRMTTMFVPDWELSSGLNRLKGGDQLRDLDPEVMRRQDHHDVSLYKPVVMQQPIHGYGHDGDEDEQFEGGLKQRLSRPIAPDVIAKPYRQDPMFVHRVEDHDEFMPKDIFNGLAHYEELEKPADMDEDPNPFRVRTENHKVNTGKMKKVTYHTK